ncbi:MAG: DNA polymerase I, partial [Lachnospiraceae bacterium]|nr:DNA polymerase I [Lachnospiraceae bacterium]
MGQDTVDQNKKILLVDGYSMLNRAFYGLPDLTNAEGKHTGAVFGFLNILFRMLDEEKPAYLAVAFDVHAPTFRHRIYDAYKGTRKPMPDELREQVPLLKEVLDAMGIARVEQEGLEADDILGTIAKRAQEQGITAAILSGDRDLLQVADEKITIVLPRTKGGKTEITRYTPKTVQDEFGVTPAQFIELKALQGDSSDNIPGVPKVGEKTARELMETYGSIEAIYANLEAISKKSIRESLRENRALCDLSKDLATIRTDSDISFAFDAACLPDVKKSAEAYELFKQLGFKQLLGRFEKTAAPETTDAGEDVTYLTVATRQQADDLFAALAEGERAGYAFVYDTAPDGNVSLLGLAVCGDDGAAYFLPAKQTRVLTEQMTLFDDTTGGSGSDADEKGGPDAD